MQHPEGTCSKQTVSAEGRSMTSSLRTRHDGIIVQNEKQMKHELTKHRESLRTHRAVLRGAHTQIKLKPRAQKDDGKGNSSQLLGPAGWQAFHQVSVTDVTNSNAS